VPNDLESVRGFAAATLQRGADQVYLFNFMDSETIPVSSADYRVLLEDGLGPDVVTTLPRRHIAAFRDTVPAGFPNGAQLPFEGEASVRLHIGPAPDKGGAIFLLGLSERDGVGKAGFDVSVNGRPCMPVADHADASRFPGVKRAVQFACPPTALKTGANEFLVRQRRDAPVQQAVWAELRLDPAG
jgi:hypothetical protein